MGVLLIVFGCVAILGGIFGKEFFAADVITLAAFKPKRSPPVTCTLHSVPCTLHPAPCTLHPAVHF
jgi:hypothetical protein